MASYTDWPAPTVSRGSGETFLFQGDVAQLRLDSSVMEGVACPQGGDERVDSVCKWVHFEDGAACVDSDGHCIDNIRETWGYNHYGTGYFRNCHTGNVLGQGNFYIYCNGYGDKSHPSTLGWQQDVHGTTHCWAGRGNCCSDAGGSGTCLSSDSAMGNYYAMLWAK